MSDNIKVVVKVRPLIRREIEEKLSYQWRVKNNTLYQLDANGKYSGAHFTFDKVYDQSTKTADVYQDVAKPIVEAAVAGFNGTIFAYGQTSSGKTYTMFGTESSPGIIPLAVFNLFEQIKCIPDRDFLVRVSYIEIYNETLKDLLNGNSDKIKVRDTLQGVKVDATEKFTSSPEEVMEIMREGEANRASGATNMNEESSRSHSLFQITIESREHTDGETTGCVNVSTLNLVDLAGSERSGQTGATGLRFKEGTLINKSLSTLALVIKQLSEGPHKHVNYRDSKLTRILQNSLGGNAKTSVICAVTPAAIEETITTLQFANRAKAIKNKPEVNAVATDATKLQDLTKKLAKLQSELALKNDIEQDNLNLQKQISSLQRMILNGFGQPRDVGARRKTWCAPRRMTISALPSVKDDKGAAVETFQTPVLKYNPQYLPSARDFPPVQRPSQLTPVMEEAIIIIPPKGKVNFSDEIINLDSDDDNTSNTSHCSPYHKCYTTSKTPPCILRKIANTAEENLKEIVELTNLEKLYNPDLVEYMAKLEKSTIKIFKLEDDLKELEAKNLEKDSEVKLLQEKIAHTENEVKSLTSAKTELEAHCKESLIKITDLEVSYEILTKKAKLREDELLSLLNETQLRRPSTTDTKKYQKRLFETFERDLSNFMDMSKDISLVSDHDSSMENSNIAETSTQLQYVINKMSAQIREKDETIINLENDLQKQKRNIESLETMCLELRVQIIKTNNKVEDVDKENTLLKSSVETLNSTIRSQKQNLEVANSDIQLYNSVIEDLQNKLAAKTDNVDLNISDNILETMIAHEEKVIANNENLKNIIQSFKNALDMRTKEIDNLKSTLERKPSHLEGEFLSESVKAKEEQLNKLIEQVQMSQEHIDENMTIINRLKQENAVLIKNKDDLSEKLLIVQRAKNQCEERNVELQKYNEENIKKFQEFNEKHDKLIIDLQNNVSELQKEKEELCKLEIVVVNKDNIISNLKSEMQVQDEVINALNHKNTELQSEINTNKNLIADLRREIQYKERLITSLKHDHTELQSEVVSKDNLIADLRSSSLCKDSLISSLSSKQTDSQDYLHKFKSIAAKLQQILSVLTGDLCVESEIIDDWMAIFNMLFDRLNDVEINAIKVVSQKELAVASTTQLELDIENLQQQLKEDKEKAENSLTVQTQQIARFMQDLEIVNAKIKKDLSNIRSQLDKQLDMVNESYQNLYSDKKENIKNSHDLLTSNEVLQKLQIELKEKLNLIEKLETNIIKWRENFAFLEESMNQRILELQETNYGLQSQCSLRDTNDTDSLKREFSDFVISQRQTTLKSLTNVVLEPGKSSPQRLLTLCATKIIDTVQPSETSLKSETPCNININFENTDTETQTHPCDCEKLQAEKDILLETHLDLKAKIQFIEYDNLKLLEEQEEIRKELQLLVEPAHELQKKISYHRTNLSTLTATTYAENKLLNSQVKVLQHHNTRFFKVCQKDLPMFKKSLQELNIILKSTSAFNRLETNIKQYCLPEVLDGNSSEANYKDESTLDGDLLMLDNNVTIASVDNTLPGADQTCLDGTHVYLDAEINTDLLETIDPNILHTQLQILSLENQKQAKKLETLQEDNLRLRELLEKNQNVNELKIDTQSSPIKFNTSRTDEALENNFRESKLHEKMAKEIELISNELLEAKAQNLDLKKKCQDLSEDLIVSDKIVLKMTALEKENKFKLAEIEQLANKLSSQNKELKTLQDENDSLSTQVMESIDESDGLRKDLDELKNSKSILTVKCAELEEALKSAKATCLRCGQKINVSPVKALSSANRSHSDSDSSSCCNKLSTLQNELLAGREDCKTISEDVATIKNQLEHGNLTLSHDMDLDYSMGEANVFTVAEDLKTNSPETNKSPSEETPPDLYTLERVDCLNYYLEKTGAESNFSQEIKIIDILKLLYNNLIAKHGNEIENLVNKLKDYEETKSLVQEKIIKIDKMHEELKDKNGRVSEIENLFIQIKDNMSILRHEISCYDADRNSFLVEKFKNYLLNVLDTEFQISSASAFETLIEKLVGKHQNDLVEIMTRYTKLQENMEQLTTELSDVTDNLKQMKCQLADKEKECNLLKIQKNLVHEISNAVTLDLVQKKKMLSETITLITKGYQTLIEHNVLNPNDVCENLAEDKCITLFVDKIIQLFKQNDLTFQEKHKLLHEVTKCNTVLEEKEQEIDSLKHELDVLHTVCKEATDELLIANKALKTQNSSHEQLNEIYEKKVEENKANIDIIQNLMQEIIMLKKSVDTKEDSVQSLREEAKTRIAKLTETVNVLQHENKKMNAVNEMITEERRQAALKLAEADDTIKKNKSELDKMTAEIYSLNQSIKENMSLIETLKIEAKSLLEENVSLKEQCREADERCSRFKLNMKTHEETAEIQCQIMNRLKKENEDNILLVNEKNKQVQELTQKCEALQKDCNKLSEDIDKFVAEASELKAAKEALRQRVSELELKEAADKPRVSLSSDPTQRPQRSVLASPTDHKKMESYFATPTKPEDLFMGVDEHSNRSTPVRSRRSDSFQSRQDESKRGDNGSRPDSALARRLRRQSTHDQLRLTHTPDLKTPDELNKKNPHNSEVSQLKERLEHCQQELEELREKYKDLDEECEICAEYLRERDKQCSQLKNDNIRLQQNIVELNEKLQNARNRKTEKCTCADASVNTDHDWTNLHSVVVDRMSFDHEVEKNRVLRRSVEVLRFRKAELKTILAKTQKDLERATRAKADIQELEATKSELESCKRELEELKERCMELDQECEICGEYLKERDEQVARLVETRAALEAKLEEVQNKDSGSRVSVRKRRQSVHDLNRNSSVEYKDQSTETSEDLLRYLVEHNINAKLLNEMQQIKSNLETMSQQKAALEMQVRTAAAAPVVPPVYVAAGSAIVQNQHLTDVMKENHKLKNTNAKLITICKKRGVALAKSSRENDNPADVENN